MQINENMAILADTGAYDPYRGIQLDAESGQGLWI